MVRSGTSSRTTMSDAAYDAANHPLAIHHLRPRSLRSAHARSAATTYGATQNGHSASTDHSVPLVISTYLRRTKDIGGQWSFVTSRVARAAATTPTVAAATAVSGSFCLMLLLGAGSWWPFPAATPGHTPMDIFRPTGQVTTGSTVRVPAVPASRGRKPRATGRVPRPCPTHK